ncbi:MAG: sigma-E factor negative regulatory protein [Gammaproteobacteria bacterium SHHR-1]|nr:sigma-E factor negative regulatory protein [gamma proteobacterium SS-5]
MQQNTAQQLSALSDDELTEFERRRLLDDLLDEPENRATLARYRLIGEAMRHDQSEALVGVGFYRGVSRALRVAADQAVETDLRRGQTGLPVPAAAPVRFWGRPLAGLALAASLSLISLWLAPQWFPDRALLNGHVELASAAEPTGRDADSTKPDQTVLAVAEPTVGDDPEQWRRLPPEMEQRLNRYLMDHAEFAAGRGMDRMLPYASFVSYEPGL